MSGKIENGSSPSWEEVWLEAITALTGSPEDALQHLSRRLRFNTAVAQALVESNQVLNRVVYGVWLNQHVSPIYIGQTQDGARRLWDLPIGESHHLANSFPPEIWTRVVVVYWDQFHPEVEAVCAKLATGRDPVIQETPRLKTIGLALEHRLQRHFQPLFNGRKKTDSGEWLSVDYARSQSIGARAAPNVDILFEAVLKVFNRLAWEPPNTGGMVEISGGKAVFPRRIAESLASKTG